MYHISCCSCFFLTLDHWPLRTTCCPLPAVSCALHIANCSFQSIPPNAKKAGIPEFRHPLAPIRQPQNPIRQPQNPIRPPKGIPRRRPPGVPCLQHSTQNRGPCAGEGLAGGGLEGPASPEEAGPSKVFSIGGSLPRRVPPRSSPSVGTFTGGALQGLLQRRSLIE